MRKSFTLTTSKIEVVTSVFGASRYMKHPQLFEAGGSFRLMLETMFMSNSTVAQRHAEDVAHACGENVVLGDRGGLAKFDFSTPDGKISVFGGREWTVIVSDWESPEIALHYLEPLERLPAARDLMVRFPVNGEGALQSISLDEALAHLRQM